MEILPALVRPGSAHAADPGPGPVDARGGIRPDGRLSGRIPLATYTVREMVPNLVPYLFGSLFGQRDDFLRDGVEA